MRNARASVRTASQKRLRVGGLMGQVGNRGRRLGAIAPVVAAICVLPIAACAKDQPSNQGVEIDQSADLAGVDANADGVRDDVAEVVRQLPVSDEMRTYLSAGAKVEQRIMTLDTASAGTADPAYDIASDANRLISCVPAGLDPADAHKHADDIQALVENTSQRQEQVGAFSALIDGRDFPGPAC